MIIEGNARPESYSPQPKGVVCIASGELSRYPAFCDSMINLKMPPGSTVKWNVGLNVAANFNMGIREGLKEGAEWVWIMGDDHEFEPDALLRLLEREVDILVPLVVRRQPPFITVLFKKPEADTEHGLFPPIYWRELPEHGLVGPEHGLYTCGSAGMLIRKRVLDAMDDPWFEAGQHGKEYTFEDTYFCVKAQKAGFSIYADTDVQIDHWTPMSLRPIRHEGAWHVAVNIADSVQAVLPKRALTGLTHLPQCRERTKVQLEKLDQELAQEAEATPSVVSVP
jgi:hypothetical protein